MKAKLEYIKEENEKIDWDEIESNMISQWYYVSKIMGNIIHADFPYFTFKGIVEEIRKDPNFKDKEEN